MTKKELTEAIQNDIEWLYTTEKDEVECISIENLEGILTKFLNERIILSEEDVAPSLKKDMLNYPHKQLKLL